MDSFDFYRLYNSLNLHFKEGSKFDFFKYQGFSRATPESFAARKDKYFFEKNSKYFSNGEEAVAFIAGNFIAGNTHITKFSKEAYLETWSKPKDSLVYNYERTLRKYIEDGNGLTQLLEQIITDEVSLIFLIVFNFVLEGKVEDKLNSMDNFSWQEIISPKFAKIKGFVESWITPDVHRQLIKTTNEIMYK